MALTRSHRVFLAGTPFVFIAANAHAAAPQAANTRAANTGAVENASAQVAAIEQRNGGRLGVAVPDTGSGLSITHHSTGRFPMCSTFKLLAAAAVLKRVDKGTEHLDRNVPFGPDDL